MMKKRSLLLSLLCGFVAGAYSQHFNQTQTGLADEYSNRQNSALNPCISAEQYQIIENEYAENRKLLKIDNALQKKGSGASLSWPLRAATGFDDCSHYTITAGVDHNPASGSFKDYNCGSVTYDAHRGTDIAIFPFPFYKMDHDQVEVVAAAAGTILNKVDGNFDKNCATNTSTANYIVITHTDGSTALYFHMKKNSLTTKKVGDPVAAGEYLGVVGSSGNSSGPHLHFEVWSGSTVSTLVDPFSGSCNSLNTASWWTAQKPYRETAVIKASVNTTDILLPPCPATETPNESNSFSVPFQGPGLAPGYAKFYIFMRGETAGMMANMSILNPDATTFNSWTYTSSSNKNGGIMGFSKLLPTNPGTYTFQASYNGTTCSKTFQITGAASVPALSSSSLIKIYPNPSGGRFSIEAENTLLHQEDNMIEIYNLTGAKVFQSAIISPKFEIVTGLESAVYFYQIKNKEGVVSSGKLLIR